MKGVAVNMSNQQQKIALERAEEGDKEKKKRRGKKKSKKTPPLPGCNSIDRICGHAASWVGDGGDLKFVISPMGFSTLKKNRGDIHSTDEQGLVKASNIAFNSLPSMHITGEVASDIEQGFYVSSKSCPESISSGRANILPPDKDYLHFHKNDGYLDAMRRKYFLPHWSVEAVSKAIEKGNAFKGSFRVNAHNRLEAYCTIEGVPTDILISGVAAQNRAIEGDVVAVMLDPVACWARLKGSASRVSSSVPTDDSDTLPEATEVISDNCRGNGKMVADCEHPVFGNGLLPSDGDHLLWEKNYFCEAVCSDQAMGLKNSGCGSNGDISYAPGPSNGVYPSGRGEAENAAGRLCAIMSSFPSKRPTGRVLAVIEESRRRKAVIGFLGVKQWLSYREGYGKEPGGRWPKQPYNSISFSAKEYIQLAPMDMRFPKMMVSVRNLPEFIQERLNKGDATVEMELVAAQIDDWSEESSLPQARVLHFFGRCGEIEPHIAAILYENAIYCANFSPESLACLPSIPWKIPEEELARREDLRNLCTFTIDSSTATDLDDALSVERISDEILRVGVHIADASYFVLPDSALDKEAQVRSTSVYLVQHKIPMFPPLLSGDLGSLIPGVDRLTFSILWDINLAGSIIDRWIGRSVIHSCCKLSYEHAQGIIDGSLDVESLNMGGAGCPVLCCQFEWPDIIRSVRILHQLSKALKENRFRDGALCLDTSKLVFLFDECGMPYESLLCERKDSNFLVEEFMLLANRTVAEVVSRVFPDCALLRRHPEPNIRKLKDFEAFCSKHGFELDTSGHLHLSLQKIREKLRNDPVLLDILISYASKPMQLAAYFCTGDLRIRETEWGHYSLAAPLYTHFTSPLRRYPDIIVHRTLAAVVEAEEVYLQQIRIAHGAKNTILATGSQTAGRCFTSLFFDKEALESREGREALSTAAIKHQVPGTAVLAEVAAHCNERKLASKHAQDAGDKLYQWALLKRKEILISYARVLGLGPKFMSIYVPKFAMERRIYYDDVEGLVIDWLETTSTLVLDLCRNKKFPKRGAAGKHRALEDAAFVISPCDLNCEHELMLGGGTDDGEATQVGSSSMAPRDKLALSDKGEPYPAVFPLTLHLLSSVPVVLHAVGGDGDGDGGPLDIGARLYLSSYFR